MALRLSVTSRRRWLNGCLQGLQILDLGSEIVLLCPTALPAISPIENEKLEAERVDLDSWLEADAQVVVVHLVELRAGMQQADVAGDCK